MGAGVGLARPALTAAAFYLALALMIEDAQHRMVLPLLDAPLPATPWRAISDNR